MTGKFLNGKSMQQKVLVIFLLLGVSLVAGTVAIMRLSIIPAFEDYENDRNLTNLSLAEQAMQGQLQSLKIFVHEYAWWDGTCEYIQSPESNPEFVEEHLYPEYWSQVDIDMMMFFDREGQLVFGDIAHPPGSPKPSLEKALGALPTAGHPLVTHESKESGVLGMLETQAGLMLVAAYPILKSNQTGPVMGSVVAGRLLTAERVAEIGAVAGVNVEIFLLSDPNLPEQITRVIPDLISSPDHAVTARFQERTYTRGLLNDVRGAPIGLMEIKAQRGLSVIGAETVTTAVLLLSLAITLFILVAWWLLRRLIVGPISALKSHIVEIGKTGDLSSTFADERRDEIGTLAFEFDTLTTKLGESQQQLKRARDDAEASSRSKSRFLATMSHEIRTPMNGVIGMTEALLRTELSERQQGMANSVKSSGELLLNIINDILDFSKINAGKMLLEKRSFPIRTLLENVHAIMAKSAQSKGIGFRHQVDSRLPECVVADDRRIEQVLINLIANAIKFTEEGEVAFSVDRLDVADQRDQSWLTLRFQVSDTGIGIRRESIGKIFEAFAQADGSTTRQYGGTGLGLAISKQLVEAMGGELGVDSVYGEGSTFHFAIRVQIAEQADSEISALQGRLAGLKVLIVDDNAANCAILQSHLERWEARSESVFSGVDALKKLDTAVAADDLYDLLLIGDRIADMHGLMFAERVWSDIRYAKPVMIVIGSVSDQFAQVDLASRGIKSCLTAPIVKEELYRHLCRALDAPSAPAGAPARDQIAAERGSESVHRHPPVDGNQSPCLDMDILVAEDNAVNQELIVMLLEELGARVVLVDNGEEALEQLHRSAFDLVVMDCQMPVMDGYAATRRIRESEFTAKNGMPIPVLAMTANALKGGREKCINAGMDAYICKPYGRDELMSVLNILLPDHRDDAAATELLDRKALDGLKALQGEGGPDLLSRLIDIYLQTSPKLVEELARGVSERDAKAVEMSAHSLKSSSARLGAKKLADQCRQFEEAGRNAELDDRGEMLQELRAAFNLACDALSAERAKETSR